MTNEIQKQYDMLENVPSIMLRMKEVYAVPNRHIRYAMTKAFFRTKMAEGSSVQSHGVKMLSLMEKLEDLKAGLENDTYVDRMKYSLSGLLLERHSSTEWLRRNRTLLDMVQSMMSFTELLSSFWSYALGTEAKLLNIAPSKSVPQTPYDIWHGKPTSYKYLRVWDSPTYVKRLVGCKLDLRSSLCRFIG
ncbi:UNVERIFIED_CONTAM: hypothetical protein Sradi_7150600 [Sesamum radiatum]|uniref:Uncharacterized protein n=1 Tax=Sesamum radiatum TaxID=300843 RepID=A0AAW2IW51_SESRA